MAGITSIGNRKPFKLIDESPVLTSGNWEPSKKIILRAWANVRQISSSRDAVNGQAGLTQFFEFKFPYRKDIPVNANIRLIYMGKKYTVHSINRDEFMTTILSQSKTFT